MNRRHALRGLGAIGAGLLPLSRAQAHDQAGAVETPLSVPDMRVRRQDGHLTTLADQLRGRVTALNLMFTGCSASCPVQGFLFSQVLDRLLAGTLGNMQLVSLSISPLTDDPAALTQWLGQYGARAPWVALSPHLSDADRLTDIFRAVGSSDDPHTTIVYVFDEQAKLAWRTLELPSPDAIYGAMRHVASQKPAA